MRDYLLFFTVFTLFILINFINTYRYSIMHDSDSFISIVNGTLFLILYSLFYAVVPRLFHTLFRIEAGAANIIFIALAAFAFLGSYTPLILGRSMAEQMVIIRFMLGKVYFAGLLLVALYITILTVVRISKPIDGRIKTLLKTGLILIAFFVPGFVMDANFYFFQVEKKIIPFGLSFVSLFYFAWNAASIYFAFRFLVTPPETVKIPDAPVDDGLPPSFLENFPLTPREKEVLELLIRGISNKEIAKLIHISAGTVKNHISNAYEKTGCENRIELVTLIQKFRA